jgi:NADH:ubiquinone oxidoreductase subunit F (NADH-binding)
VRGLCQRPTVVNNVETLANITGIVRDGAGRSQVGPRGPGDS